MKDYNHFFGESVHVWRFCELVSGGHIKRLLYHNKIYFPGDREKTGLSLPL